AGACTWSPGRRGASGETGQKRPVLCVSAILSLDSSDRSHGGDRDGRNYLLLVWCDGRHPGSVLPRLWENDPARRGRETAADEGRTAASAVERGVAPDDSAAPRAGDGDRRCRSDAGGIAVTGRGAAWQLGLAGGAGAGGGPAALVSPAVVSPAA